MSYQMLFNYNFQNNNQQINSYKKSSNDHNQSFTKNYKFFIFVLVLALLILPLKTLELIALDIVK